LLSLGIVIATNSPLILRAASKYARDGALSIPMISIIDVDTSSDLRVAKVYFSVYGDEEVIQAANEFNIAMIFTGMRQFRH